MVFYPLLSLRKKMDSYVQIGIILVLNQIWFSYIFWDISFVELKTGDDGWFFYLRIHVTRPWQIKVLLNLKKIQIGWGMQTYINYLHFYVYAYETFFTYIVEIHTRD